MARSAAAPPFPGPGFTLVEMLVTMLILSILLAIGVPLMRDFIVEARLSANVNQFVAAATLARTEAIKGGRPVVFCRSVNAESGAGRCVAGAGDGRNGNDWGSGWIVMASGDNQALLRQAALHRKISADGGNKAIKYDGLGRPGASFTSVVFKYDGGFERTVCFSRSGRIRVVAGAGC